jgi:AcrR family transcriptional regulator
VALRAFATLGYDGVVLRTLNRELGGSHNLLNGRFGSKEGLWYATVDWAFQPLVMRLATAFDPTLSDPLDQLRTTIRAFLLYSAERPELLGLMNIEGRQDTERLAYLYNTYAGSAGPSLRRRRSPGPGRDRGTCRPRGRSAHPGPGRPRLRRQSDRCSKEN